MTPRPFSQPGLDGRGLHCMSTLVFMLSLSGNKGEGCAVPSQPLTTVNSLITPLTLPYIVSSSIKGGMVINGITCDYSRYKILSHLSIDQRAEKFCFLCQFSNQQYFSSLLQHHLRPFEGFCFGFQHVSIDVYCHLKAGRDLAHLCILAPLAASDMRCFCQQGPF